MRSKIAIVKNDVIQNQPNQPEIIDIIAKATSTIMTHFNTLNDILIMPLITENPRSNATMRIIIPNQIKRSIFSSLILYFLSKSIYIYGETGRSLS